MLKLKAIQNNSALLAHKITDFLMMEHSRQVKMSPDPNSQLCTLDFLVGVFWASSRGGGGSVPSLGHRPKIATKCYQIDVSGVAILHVLCHGIGVDTHREVRVTIGLDLLRSGLITPFYIT